VEAKGLRTSSPFVLVKCREVSQRAQRIHRANRDSLCSLCVLCALCDTSLFLQGMLLLHGDTYQGG
jgi:hypothetical protein